MMSEKRVRQEVEELRSQVKKLQEAERRDRRKLADDEAVRKIKKLEETISDLHKNLQAQKQVYSLSISKTCSFFSISNDYLTDYLQIRNCCCMQSAFG